MDKKVEKVVKQHESEFAQKYSEKKSLIFSTAKNDLAASVDRHINAARIFDEFKTQIKVLKKFGDSKKPPSDNAIEKVVKEIYANYTQQLDNI